MQITRNFFIAIVFMVATFVITGCGLLRPGINAGYYINNEPDSKTTVLLGTNNTQANAIHARVDANTGQADDVATANENDKLAKSSGLFVNNTVGDRSADFDTTAALEVLKNVRGTSAGQSQTTTKGDESPATGEQTQTPTQTETTTTNVPLAVKGGAATIDNSQAAQPTEP